MASRQTSGAYSEGKPGRFGFLMSVFAFLPYFLLPLTYYVHLTASFLPAASVNFKTGSPIIETQDGEPAPAHDSNTCPLCRGASSFQNNGVSMAIHAPDSNSLVRLLGDGYCFTGRAKADAVMAYTRAPPGASLAQSTA